MENSPIEPKEFMRNKITEGTFIPISFAVLIFFCCAFVLRTSFETGANTKDIAELKTKNEKFEAAIVDFAVIKTKVENIEKAVK